MSSSRDQTVPKFYIVRNLIVQHQIDCMRLQEGRPALCVCIFGLSPQRGCTPGSPRQSIRWCAARVADDNGAEASGSPSRRLACCTNIDASALEGLQDQPAEAVEATCASAGGSEARGARARKRSAGPRRLRLAVDLSAQLGFTTSAAAFDLHGVAIADEIGAKLHGQLDRRS